MTESEFYHKEHIALLSNHFLENDWVWLYKKSHLKSNDIDLYYLYYCYLATPLKTYDALRSASLDISPESRISLMADYSYRSFANPGFEHLVVVREFKISNKNITDIRLSEEIIFYHKLLERKNTDGSIQFYQIKDNSETLVCIIEQNSVRILNRFLVEFLAAKQMDLVCFCQSEVEFELGNVAIPFKINCTKNQTFEDITNVPNSIYKLSVAPCFRLIQSWFNGKFIFRHPSLKKIILSMYPPVKYIIGTDEYGNFLYNDENSNPYLLLFFRKKVLSHYTNHQGRFSNPLCIRTPTFSLRCDNDNVDYIIAFLKDILDLPYEDQCIWQGFNIPSDGRTFSKIFLNSIIQGNWNGVAESTDFVFRDVFSDFAKKWYQKYEWDLFKPLKDIQADTLEKVTLVHDEDYDQLKDLVENITLLLQESINDKALNRIVKKDITFKDETYNGLDYKAKQIETRISHLSRACDKIGIDASLLAGFMCNLQTLRSFMLHRNRENIDKPIRDALKYFSFNENKSNTVEVSHNILNYGISALKSVIKQLD